MLGNIAIYFNVVQVLRIESTLRAALLDYGCGCNKYSQAMFWQSINCLLLEEIL